MRPAQYEFDQETKLKILRRDDFSCVECGRHKLDTPEGFVEIDHIIPIWFVLKYAPWASLALITSVANGQCLCHECHERKHENESIRELSALAQSLLGISLQVAV